MRAQSPRTAPGAIVPWRGRPRRGALSGVVRRFRRQSGRPVDRRRGHRGERKRTGGHRRHRRPGEGTGAGGSAGGGQATAFACDATAKPPVGVLRRLTMTQYRNTIADLVTWSVGASAAGAVLAELATPLGGLPDDHREAVPQDLHGSYRRLDQSLQQIHVDATYDVAVAAGAALTTAARLGTVVGSCATDTSTTNDAACLDAFVRRFGARALRRPLASDEVDFYKSVYGPSATASRRRPTPT